MSILTETFIPDIVHPIYRESILDWIKWRISYEGGRRFINEYMQKFSSREDDVDFLNRKNISYCPAFAKAAINDVKNSIFQRFVDIIREGGSQSYQEAISGEGFGVDLLGNSMNSFIGRKILPELLVMKKVGIYVDMPTTDIYRASNEESINSSNSLNETKNNKVSIFPSLKDVKNYNLRPYLYLYTSEDIRSWYSDESCNPNEYSSLLLRESHYQFDDTTHLPIGMITIYKHFWVENGQVYVQHYDDESNSIDSKGNILENNNNDPIPLYINRIPFVVLELSTSLMADIADYQIALLNLGSSDISYALKANFPFYTEQYDPRLSSAYLKGQEVDNEIDIGPTQGRRYPINTNTPSFIHPSPEPLLASMKKQEQLKQEIRLLVNLAITNIEPKMASAESKGFDERSLESGLSYIGLELEHAEREIAKIWDMYENGGIVRKSRKNDYGENIVAVVKYPEKYDLKTDSDRRENAKQYQKLLGSLPSQTYQREIAKLIANSLLGSKISRNVLLQIYDEIDQAKIINIPPDVIVHDVEQGLVGLETASEARGYPPGEVDKAKQDHADRLARIAQTQGIIPKNNQSGNNSSGNGTNPDSRGVSDLSSDTSGARKEKQESKDNTFDPTPSKKVRGKGQ